MAGRALEKNFRLPGWLSGLLPSGWEWQTVCDLISGRVPLASERRQKWCRHGSFLTIRQLLFLQREDLWPRQDYAVAHWLPTQCDWSRLTLWSSTPKYRTRLGCLMPSKIFNSSAVSLIVLWSLGWNRIWKEKLGLLWTLSSTVRVGSSYRTRAGMSVTWPVCVSSWSLVLLT